MKQAYIIERDEALHALAEMHKDWRYWATAAEDATGTAQEETLCYMAHTSFNELEGAVHFLVSMGMFDSWTEAIDTASTYAYRHL